MALNITLGKSNCSLPYVYKLAMVYDVTLNGAAAAVGSSQVQKPVAMIDFTAIAFLDYLCQYPINRSGVGVGERINPPETSFFEGQG